MKKIVLIAAAALMSVTGFAQQSVNRPLKHAALVNAMMSPQTIKNAKTTGNGDTLIKSYYNSATDTLTLFVPDVVTPYDSGFTAGMNARGQKGYAERYTINGADSSIQPLGVYIYFYGRANSGSTKTVRVAAWSQGPKTPVTGRPKLFFNGVPSTLLNSVNVNLKDLRDATGVIDSFGLFRFPTPAAYINDSFFVGYDMSYNWASLGGDTITVIQTERNSRKTPGYFVQGTDTVVNVQNATLLSNNTWVDNLNGAGGNGIANHYIMFAMFKVKIGTGGGVGVNGITNNDLTVFGTYPNPANNIAKLKFSLNKPTDVSLVVLDMGGRIVYSTTEGNLATGAHELPINTANLAAGNYHCLIRTASGGSMGIEMTVVK
jgi:hypothetical protein